MTVAVLLLIAFAALLLWIDMTAEIAEPFDDDLGDEPWNT